MGKRINLGIAGCGNSARTIHYPKLADASGEFEVAACFDLDAGRAREAGSLYGAKSYSELDAFLGHPGLELVLVATKPASTHTEIGLAALEAGKHVLLEKPMCGSREEGLRLMEKAAETKRILTVYHNRRTAEWDPDFAGLTWMVGQGVLGNVKMFESTVCGNLLDADWIFDWGIHIFDQVLTLLKEKPLEVICGAAGSPPENALKGPWAALVRLEKGKTGLASMRSGAPGSHTRFSVMGDRGGCAWPRGSARFEGADRSELTVESPAVYRGRGMEALSPSKTVIKTETFYHNLYRAVTGQCPPMVKPEEALRAVDLALAAMESAETGKAVKI